MLKRLPHSIDPLAAGYHCTTPLETALESRQSPFCSGEDCEGLTISPPPPLLPAQRPAKQIDDVPLLVRRPVTAILQYKHCEHHYLIPPPQYHMPACLFLRSWRRIGSVATYLVRRGKLKVDTFHASQLRYIRAHSLNQDRQLKCLFRNSTPNPPLPIPCLIRASNTPTLQYIVQEYDNRWQTKIDVLERMIDRTNVCSQSIYS